MARKRNIDELQLHDEEGTPDAHKRHRSNDAATKLTAVAWAKRVSINSAHKKFGVDRKCIKDWMAKEEKLKCQVDSAGGAKRQRLDGGGRHVMHPDRDIELA